MWSAHNRGRDDISLSVRDNIKSGGNSTTFVETPSAQQIQGKRIEAVIS
jgi:hypothetical protein